jgi:hypothetical protein
MPRSFDMQKKTKIVLYSFAAVVGALVIAAAGFYEGFNLGARTMAGIEQNNEAHRALAEIRSSMVMLGNNDLILVQHRAVVQLRFAVFDLGTLSNAATYIRCTDEDKRALGDATAYLAAHSDSAIPSSNPVLMDGMKFCASSYGDTGAPTASSNSGKK